MSIISVSPSQTSSAARRPIRSRSSTHAFSRSSSLAAVLTFATFAATGLVSAPVAAALAIGANLGGAVVPAALLLGADRLARLIALGNIAARGGVKLAFLGALHLVLFHPFLSDAIAGQLAIALHIVLNLFVLLLALPFAGSLVRLAEHLVPDHTHSVGPSLTALDESALDHPPLALACAQRELLRMAETVQAIFLPVMSLFRAWAPETARIIQLGEDRIDRMHFETTIYVSRLRKGDLSDGEEKKTLEIVATANSLEEAGDRIAINLVALAEKMRDDALAFSEAARQLVAEKDRIRVEEQRLQERHLKRLQRGGTASIETTNIHHEVLRLLKQINAALSYVAYPIAEETGDLLRSRLARPKHVGGMA